MAGCLELTEGGTVTIGKEEAETVEKGAVTVGIIAGEFK